jgi:hypothetical protein
MIMEPLLAFLHIDASYLIALALVAFYASARFNTPRSVRSQTSRFQYLGSCAMYVVSCLGLLITLTWVLGSRPGLLGFLHTGSSAALPDELSGLDASLVAALALTTLLPSFPILRDFDAKMLSLFHTMGAIPFGAIRWAQQLDAASFVITDRLLADTKNYISNSKRLPDTLIDELQPDSLADRARYRFTRSLALYVALSNLKSRARFGEDFPDDTAAFEKKINTFFMQCISYFSLSNQLSKQQLQPAPESMEEFRSMVLETYEDIRLMLARVLLYSCSGEVDMAHKLEKMGFSIDRPNPIRMPLNLLCFDMIGVIALFASATVLSSGQMPVGKAFSIGLLVAVNHSIAAAFALLPKQVWNFADIRCARERPVLGYVISGLCALTVTLPILYGFYLVRVHWFPDSGPIMPFAGQSKWLLLSTVLAVALAYACDDFIGAKREPGWLRWAEGAGLAALMAFTGLLVVNWLQSDQAALHLNEARPRLWTPVLLSASIGALFGTTIPHWYRWVMRHPEGNQTWSPSCPPPRSPPDLLENAA